MITRKDIGDFYMEVRDGMFAGSAQGAVLHLLLKSLSPAQKAAYCLMLDMGTISSITLSEKYGWKLNYSGNILKSLHNVGLCIAGWAETGKVMEYSLLAEEQ